MNYLPHHRWLRTHQQSVDAILGPGVRKVVSEGTAFKNLDTWFLNLVVNTLCEKIGQGWNVAVHDAVTARFPHKTQPRITIASTPVELTPSMASALTGGAYHEALHTLWSRRTPVRREEIQPWASLFAQRTPEFWGLVAENLIKLANIVEDIRLERRGCEKFHIREKMEHLQDLVLELEGAAQAPSYDPKAFFQIVVLYFRDKGLGYQTPMMTLTREAYRKICPEAVSFVETQLGDLLDRAMKLTEADTVGTYTIALELVLRFSDKDALSDFKTQGDATSDVEGQEAPEGDETPEGRESQPRKPSGSKSSKKGKKAQEPKPFEEDDIQTADASKVLGEKIKGMEQKEGFSSFAPRDLDGHKVSTVKEKGGEPSTLDGVQNDKVLYTRTRLLRLLRAQEMATVIHGQPHGKLSPRRLVDSYLTLKGGEIPTRAYYQVEEGRKESVAFALSIDESASMLGDVVEVGKIVAFFAKLFHEMKAPAFISGWATGGYGVDHSIYKDWNETILSPQVRGRFTKTRATGGTPMDGGIFMGLQALNHRTEGHRVLIVITDGEPDFRDSVINLLQIAQSRGVLTVGVGIRTQSVMKLFPVAFCVSKVEDIVEPLVNTITPYVDPSCKHRGRRIV